MRFMGRWLTLASFAGWGLGVAASAACTDATFYCIADDQCANAGQAGWCEASGQCSFSDPECPSGRRFGNLSSDGGRCVDPEALPQDTGGSSSDEGPASGGHAEAWGDGADGSTTFATTSDGTSETGDPRPTCGDGLVEGDEECDQSCTVDGDCESEVCEAQRCVLVTSCLQLLELRPQSTDGPYPIDLDGEGGEPTSEVDCDMTTDGGGWTRVVRDSFEQGVPSGWSVTISESCSDWGSFLGPFGEGGSATRSVELGSIDHDQLRVDFEAFILDSWDHETLRLRIDDALEWERTCDYQDSETCGMMSDECNGGYDDGRLQDDVTVDHVGLSATLDFDSTLDQSADDEAWGIAELSVWVR